MGNIVLARIDDRLIHGQVMTAWVSYVGGTEIRIVDDAVANDPFLSMVITGAAPKRLDTKVLTVEQTITELKNADGEADKDKKYILLAKEPKAFLSLIENGVSIPEINLGGMGMKGDRQKIYKTIAVDESEKEVFKKMIKLGTYVYIQVVPNMEKVDLEKYLK